MEDRRAKIHSHSDRLQENFDLIRTSAVEEPKAFNNGRWQKVD